MALAEPPNTLAQAPEAIRPSQWQRWTDNFSILFDSRVAMFGLTLVLFWIIVGLVSLVWTPYPPNASLFIQNQPPLSPNELGGINILGTDNLGRDLLSRLMTGTQVILLKTRMPATTASRYMYAFAVTAGLVSLTAFLAAVALINEQKAKRNFMLLAAVWFGGSVALYYTLPRTVPTWAAFAIPFALIFLAFLGYGWFKAKEAGISDMMKIWTVSLGLLLLFLGLSLPLQGTAVPAFPLPIGVAIWGVIGSLIIGSILGVNAAYRAGGWDQSIMQLLDALIAFPVIVLYLVVIAALGQGDLVVILAITITGAPGVARLVRGLTLDIKTRDYIRAAETRGESKSYIMFREILPNARGPILVDAMLRVGYAIFAIGTLGFLGIGLPPPDPDWGSMVNDARQFIFTNQWAVIWPALAIASLVIGLNFFADGMREELTRYQK
jgi:peptide/nickel transport system permease protein